MRLLRPVPSTLLVATTALFVAASPAHAQAAPAKNKPAQVAPVRGQLRGVIRLAGDYGGEKIGEFQYSDGSTPDVVAGGGLVFTGGAAYTMLARGLSSLDAQVNVGVKYRTIPPADNQEASWLRFPLEGLLFWRTPIGLRLGAGATVHLHNTLSASGAVLNDKVEFENTPGVLLQAEYVRRNIGFDLRYTSLKYSVADASGNIDASSIGAGLSFFFGH
jgi:hypothetical protein